MCPRRKIVYGKRFLGPEMSRCFVPEVVFGELALTAQLETYFTPKLFA
jgi:hypothetical protein